MSDAVLRLADQQARLADQQAAMAETLHRLEARG